MDGTINKDVVYGMMLNALMQMRDGTPVEELTVNPDMEKYRDYSLDEVIALARLHEYDTIGKPHMTRAQMLDGFLATLPNVAGEGYTFDYDDENEGVAYVTSNTEEFKVEITEIEPNTWLLGSED